MTLYSKKKLEKFFSMLCQLHNCLKACKKSQAVTIFTLFPALKNLGHSDVGKHPLGIPTLEQS